MLRVLALIALLLSAGALSCGDDEDPATSQRCKDARAQWLAIKQAAERANQADADLHARAGCTPTSICAFHPDTSYQVTLGKIENENWDCFH